MNMSKGMFRQQVTLTVTYDLEEYDHPMYWDWTELCGSFCRVVDSSEVNLVIVDDGSDF